MIPRHVVTTAIVAALADDLTGVVGIYRELPPTPTPDAYAVVTFPSGSVPVGGLGRPEEGTGMRVDLRTVATATRPEMAARECERLADRVLASALAVLPGLSGDGWSISGRQVIGDSGVGLDAQATERGITANNVATLALRVTP